LILKTILDRIVIALNRPLLKSTFILYLLFSCKNSKTDEIKTGILATRLEISRLKEKVNKEQDFISTLQPKIDSLDHRDRALLDSTRICYNNSPIATECIYATDNQPLITLSDILDTDKKEKLRKLAEISICKGYEQLWPGVIDTLRKHYRRIDQEDRLVLQRKQDLNQEIVSHKNTITETGDRIGELETKIDYYKFELDSLNR